ncbi:MAG TPA: hypothetical protein VFQ24_11130 [Terriglobia bacterium]|nr:hypothetical protein [Terriglobia bacterium]
MAITEHFREVVNELPDAAFFTRRAEAGWKLIALEWERAGEVGGALPQREPVEEVPYGLRVAGDCHHLEQDPEEFRALLLMMEQIVLDLPLSKVAEALNDAGLLTRQGLRWDRVSVFNMLPRLIEIGPRMFSTEEWRVRRRSIFQVA